MMHLLLSFKWLYQSYHNFLPLEEQLLVAQSLDLALPVVTYVLFVPVWVIGHKTWQAIEIGRHGVVEIAFV